jgi:hypothetical protein
MHPFFGSDSAKSLGHAAAHSLTDCSASFVELEGPYTRLGKLCIVNAMNAQQICHALTKKSLSHSDNSFHHSRSLLHSPWLKEVEANSLIGKEITAFSMDGLCGNWASRIASDEHLRFCSSCLRVGFQSSLFQIDALTRCPIHNDPLLEHCPHCQQPTPRYALTAEGFDAPLHCARCGLPYAAFWGEKRLRYEAARTLELERLRIIARELGASRSLVTRWPDFDSWRMEPHHSSASRTVRAAAATSLGEVLHIAAFQNDAFTIYAEDARPEIFSDQPQTDLVVVNLAQRRQIYKSVRRQIEEMIQPIIRLRRMGIRRIQEFLDIDWVSGTALPTSRQLPEEVHAWVLWRHRCESNFLSALMLGSTDSSCVNVRCEELELRPTVCEWPTRWGASPELWGRFVWHCFWEDLRTAFDWKRLAEDALNEAERSFELRRWPVEIAKSWAIHEALRGRLSPQFKPWPEALTAYALSPQDASSPRLIMIVRSHADLRKKCSPKVGAVFPCAWH